MKGGSAFSFTFSPGGTNPDSVRDAGFFTVETFSFVSSAYWPIDYIYVDQKFTPDPVTLVATINNVSSFVAYFSPATYTI